MNSTIFFSAARYLNDHHPVARLTCCLEGRWEKRTLRIWRKKIKSEKEFREAAFWKMDPLERATWLFGGNCSKSHCTHAARRFLAFTPVRNSQLNAATPFVKNARKLRLICQ